MKLVMASETVWTPSLAYKTRARKVLEYSLQVMSAISVAAQAVIKIELREERTPTALIAIFMLFCQRRFVWPAQFVQQLRVFV